MRLNMIEKKFSFDGYEMRLLQMGDVDEYYKKVILESDDEAKYYTGPIGEVTRDQVIKYIDTIVNNESRYDFIITFNHEIIGEVVIKDIEGTTCHYRICIFNKAYFSKGIGYIATRHVFDFAFKDLQVKTIELEVFPFNKRGISLYKKLGFEHIESIVDKDAEELYKNINIMRLTKENYTGS